MKTSELKQSPPAKKPGPDGKVPEGSGLFFCDCRQHERDPAGNEAKAPQRDDCPQNLWTAEGQPVQQARENHDAGREAQAGDVQRGRSGAGRASRPVPAPAHGTSGSERRLRTCRLVRRSPGALQGMGTKGAGADGQRAKRGADDDPGAGRHGANTPLMRPGANADILPKHGRSGEDAPEADPAARSTADSPQGRPNQAFRRRGGRAVTRAVSRNPGRPRSRRSSIWPR